MRRPFFSLVIFSLVLFLFSCDSALTGQTEPPLCGVKALFVSPEVDQVIEEELIRLIGSATQTLNIAMYYFTDDDLGMAVIDAHRRGIRIRIILDESQVNASGGEYQKLRDAGIPVAIEDTSGLMHHKSMVIDKEITVTGSYNWTASADDRNFENLRISSSSSVLRSHRPILRNSRSCGKDLDRKRKQQKFLPQRVRR